MDDVTKISLNDTIYPSSLRDLFGGLAAPDLWCRGNVDLLRRSGVGFCGSRNASERGIEVASDCATQFSEASVVVISGYAAGVDMASHEAALMHGGQTVVILPEGIDQFRIKKSVKDLWDWDRVLVLSHFPRNSVWRADRAMERNKLIVALSGAVVVIEAGETGGTLNAGFCALKMNKPLFVAVYDQTNRAKGNEILLQQGGRKLQRSRATRRAQLSGIFEVLERQN